CKASEIKHFIRSVAPSGLGLCNTSKPGVITPVCVLAPLWGFLPDSNIWKQIIIINHNSKNYDN
ncbi:MAG: hypothetical protein IJQ48_00020, partial [Prevotella sp.]|nr:hypothetical protein [Prevotella sp.]